MDFEPTYHRFNQSSPLLCGPYRSTSFQAPDYQNEGLWGVPTALHQRSASATLASPTENMEDVDTSTRPRLTQEQVTELETEFSKLPKPNTDFKKNLADRIGLTLARVNNWYQNRRAKSKNGLKMTEARFEVRPTDPHNHWAALDAPLDDFANMSYFDPANPQLLSPDEDGNRGTASYFFEDGDCGQYNARSSAIDMQDPLHYAFDSSDFVAGSLGFESAASDGQTKMTVPDAAEVNFDRGNYSPENVAGIAIPEDMPTDQPFRPMYQIASNGTSLGNLSSLTFMSATSSSDGEPSLMTPPTKPSPPAQQQDLFKRRDSLTGALTSGLHTFHLQSQRSNQALYEEAANAKSRQASPVGSTLQWVNSSPPQSGTQEPSVLSLSSRVDLAARRKRPRPAPLVQPQAAQRSLSCNAPLTSSPRSRSRLLDPTHPVRRVRSGLDVLHGRVQKSGSTPAQLSPRVFENRFQAAFPQHRSPSRGTSSTYQQAPLTPLSAAHNSECHIGFPSYHSNDGIAQRSMSGTYNDSYDFNSPPITPHHFEQLSGRHAQETYNNCTSTMHEPPQSAPPQKTSFFFGDSPPMPNSNLSHLGWQMPAEAPSHVLQSQNPIVVGQPHYNPVFGHLEQASLPYAYHAQLQQPPQIPIPFHGPPPQVYQSSPDHLYAPHAQYPLHQYQPGPMGPFQHNIFEAQPVQQPLEIKVELGPSPQGTPQAPKQFTFSNSTPEDFASPKEEA